MRGVDLHDLSAEASTCSGGPIGEVWLSRPGLFFTLPVCKMYPVLAVGAVKNECHHLAFNPARLSIIRSCLSVGAQLPIQATFTPSATGKAEALIACCTVGPNPPAGFSAVSHVKGLSVSYALHAAPTLTPLSKPSTPMATSAAAALVCVSGRQLDASTSAQTEAADFSDHDSMGRLSGKAVQADFGECDIGKTKSLLLTIANDTPIAASVNLWLDTFQTDLPMHATGAVFGASRSAAVSADPLLGGMTGSRSHVNLPSLTAGTSGADPSQNATAPTSGMLSADGTMTVSWHKGYARRAGSQAGLSRKRRQSVVRPVSALFSGLILWVWYLRCKPDILNPIW